MKKKSGSARRLTNVQLIALSFLALIACGTVLLCLPWATRSGAPAAPGDALFTATSAACVTGLAVQDTGLYWSAFGQAVILLLIQIGGLGFITIATFTLTVLRRRVGIRNRERMVESINTADNGSILALTRTIMLGTGTVELCGAALLAVRFVPRLGAGRGLWYAVFHAVSAFCNAGFDLMGPIDGPYASLTAYAADPLVTLTVMALILIGGLGFWVWDDLLRHFARPRRFRLQTKLVLTVTGALTVGGAALFFLLEHGTRAGQPFGEQLLRALFDAVTPRTAGFSVTDAAALSPGGKLLTIMFMFVGGSSGSTAGGIKTTTLAVLLLYTAAQLTGRREAGAFGRRFSPQVLPRAVAVAAGNLMLALLGGIVLTLLHPALPLADILLETFSAIGTVGMSTGITRSLGTAGRAVLVLLMYCGRIGSLSFSAALHEQRTPPPVQDPTEQIVVG